MRLDMAELIKKSCGSALLALAATSACHTVSETDDAPTPAFQQALTKENVLVDSKGRRWKNNGKVTYANARYEEHQREVQASARLASPKRSLANLDELTDEEAVQVMRPRMEFGNTEFLMEDDDARELVVTFRRLKKERLSGAARGASMGEDGSRIEQRAAGEVAGEVSQGLIINGDQRANNNHRAHQFPYNMIAQGGTNDDRWCTCFKMINDHTCITAGHCHWWRGQWQARRPITFQAGSSSPRTQIPANCYTRTTLYSGGDDHSADVAVIALRGRGGAWCDPGSYSGDWFGWNEPVQQFSAWTAGYPAPPPFGWSYPTQTHQSSSNNEAVFPTTYVSYTLDMTGGQSGAPIVTTWSTGGYRVRASHWGALSSSADKNAGIGMSRETVNVLSGWAGF
jgi:V8-like Glu-specific endopeptidase